jgi:hypothetical protein
MKSLDEYCRWFMDKAQELPHPIRQEVMNTLDTSDYRAICFSLARLCDAGKLPKEWNTVLDDFCGRTY